MQGVVLLGDRDKTKQGGNARYTKHRNTGDGQSLTKCDQAKHG